MPKNTLHIKNIDIQTTHIMLKTDINCDIKPFIQNQREIILNEIKENPNFLKSYTPIPLIDKKPILKLMTKAGEIANTGPMAAVAGSISEMCLDYLESFKSKFSIVENGGDIALKTNKKINMGIYAGKTSFSYNYGFKIKPKPYKYGICTSSYDGPSKSFGSTDATIVFSKQSSIADSLATSIGNYGNGDTENEVVHNALSYAEKYSDYYEGVLVIKGETLGKTGHIPQLISINNTHVKEAFEIE